MEDTVKKDQSSQIANKDEKADIQEGDIDIEQEEKAFRKQKLKIPLETQLPAMEKRVFDNDETSKGKYTKKLDLKFGELTDKNVEQFRILNYLSLPVVYSEDFYRKLFMYQRYSKLCYLKDVLVGAISCKYDHKDGEPVIYIMTITVLKPYRRMGIASQLLDQAIADCQNVTT